MTAADRIRRATWVLFAIGCAVMMTVQLLRVRTRLGRHDLDGRARAERLQRTQPPTGRIAHAALSMPRIAAPTAQPVRALSYPSAVHRHDCCLSYRSCCQANSSRRLQSQPPTRHPHRPLRCLVPWCAVADKRCTKACRQAPRASAARARPARRQCRVRAVDGRPAGPFVSPSRGRAARVRTTHHVLPSWQHLCRGGRVRCAV